jgi:anti-anti-sigma factor
LPAAVKEGEMLLEIENIPGPGLRLTGEADISNSLQVEDALAQKVARGGDVVLDLSGLAFADSTFFHLVIQCAQQLDDRRLVLACPTRNVEKMMDLLGLTRIPNVTVQDSRPTIGWGFLLAEGQSNCWITMGDDRRRPPVRLSPA